MRNRKIDDVQKLIEIMVLNCGCNCDCEFCFRCVCCDYRQCYFVKHNVANVIIDLWIF